MPTGAAVAQPTTRGSRKRAFRPDIEGLRAFAVVLVVLDHFFRVPRGGFVGVDVFYVISGFLITGLLLREHQRAGSISFVDFYRRRIKRILPAAVLVLAVTVVTAYVVWFQPRADQTLSDAIAALFFVANWHFARMGTDYLQANGPVSPVQHYWSLSVEEQFYAVWPLILLAVLTLALKIASDRARAHRVVAWTLVVLIGGSFLYSCYRTLTNPTEGYFDTIGRAWELGAGAFLAVIAPRLASIPRRAAAIGTWAGVTILVASAFIISPESAFPGPWAVVPVAATCLVIAAGSSRDATDNVALTNPASRYLGRISYSLYLWHFPIVVFGVALLGPLNPATAIGLLLLTLAVSAASYHFVEDRVRRSNWLEQQRDAERPHNVRQGPQVVLAVGVAVAIVVLSVAQLRGPTFITNGPEARALVTSASTEPAGSDSPAIGSDAELQDAIAAALSADSWPTLTPTLDELSETQGAPEMSQTEGCRNDISRTDPLICTINPGQEHTALVIGDSVAVSWIPTVEAALPDWTVIGLGYASCPAIEIRVGDATFADKCTAAQARMLDYASTLGADIVFTSSAQSTLSRLVDVPAASAETEWASATERTVAQLVAAAPSVVVLGSPPAGSNPHECATRGGSPQNCTAEVSPAWEARTAAEAEATTTAGGTYVDVRDWFCDASGRCPLFIDGTVARFDGAHLTDAMAARLGGVLRNAL